MKRAVTLVLLPLLFTSLLNLNSHSVAGTQDAAAESQDPKPQEKRGIGLEASPTPTPDPTQASQFKGPNQRPEIVLQAGITTPQTQLAFSPDGQLLASMGMMGNSIKLWEISSGRILRQLESSIPAMGASSMTRPFRFSSDGRTLVNFTEGRLRRWDVGTGKELTNTLLPAAKNLTIALLSEDASRLAALNLESSMVRLWDLNAGTELRPIAFGEEEQIASQSAIALGPNGKMLAAITGRYETSRKGLTSSSQVTIWDVESGKKKQALKIRSTPYTMGMTYQEEWASVSFSPDGSWLAVRNKDEMRIWDIESGKEIKSFSPAGGVTSSLDPTFVSFGSTFVFSPDKRLLSMVTDANKINIVDASSTSTLYTLQAHDGTIVGLGFSRDGKLLASSATDNQIKLWDVASGTQLRTLSGAAVPISDLAFSPDGKSLTMAGQEAVSFWELTNGGVRRAVVPGVDYTSPLAFMERGSILSPDGRLMMAGSHVQSMVKIWDVASGKEKSTLTLAPGKVLANAAFSPDGRTLVVMEMENKKPGTPSQSQATQLPSNPSAGAVSMPDPTKLMDRMRKDPKKMQEELKKVQDRMAQGDLSAGMELMESLGMMPATAKKNPNSLRFFEAASGKELNTVPLPGGLFNQMSSNSMASSSAISFSPDHRVLASASGFGAPVRLIDVSTGQELRSLKSPFTLSANTLAWSPDGKQLASANWGMKKGFDPQSASRDFSFEDVEFAIRLWDPATGTELRTLAGHKNFVMRLAYSADGKTLASGSFDSTIKLWDVNSGRELHTLSGHTGSISALAFSPDGRFIMSGSDDGSARLWNTQSGELLATLASLNGGNDWLVVTPAGLFDGSPGGWNQILWRFSPALSDVSPVEIFFNEYFHPGLLSDIIEGKKLAVTTDISRRDRRQPKVALTAVDAQPNSAISNRTTRVAINISEAPAGAQDVRLFRNGSLVKLWRGDVLKNQPAATLETTVSLVAGANELRAYAFNRDNVKSADATLLLRGADSLKRAGTLHLIVAAVNQYANEAYNLKYAVADGQAFAAEVERQQRKLGRYSQFEVTTLFDQNATKANLESALRRLAGATGEKLPAGAPPDLEKITPAQPEDAVLIYYAGHGTAQDQRFYLIPHDLGYAGKRTELDEAGLRDILAHSISDLELEDAFEGIDAGLALMVIDACNSGQALEATEKRRGPMNSKGLAQLAYEKGMYILTAAQSYQAALEAEQLGHGYLTFALVEEGLKSAKADDEPADGEVLLREWLNYATERVPEMQQQKMKAARGLRIELAFVEGEEQVTDVDKRNVQRPRVFYRRELETQPFVVAKP